MCLFVYIIAFFLIQKDLTPEQFFGESYTDAVIYCKNNKSQINKELKLYDVNSRIAVSIIFPELIRYNRLSDFFETSALEIAYINGGKEYADFSIGQFQMKPSFVEMLENELLKQNDSLIIRFKDISKYPNLINENKKRTIRLSRLKNKIWQLKYLACFYCIAEVKFKKEIKNEEQMLLILSSAYNLGLNSSIEDIYRISKTKSFPYGNPKTGRFSYYDVADYFYKKHSNKYFK